MTVSLLPGTGTYDFRVPDPTPAAPDQTRIQKVPAGIVHVSYAVFTGNAEQEGTKINYTRSMNYGDSWDPTTTLSEGQSINQAPDIGVDPATRRVVVVWRRFANPTANQSDAIMSAISLDDGRSFGKADGRREHLFLHAGDDVGELPHHNAPVHHIRRHRLPRHLGRSARGRAAQPRPGTHGS